MANHKSAEKRHRQSLKRRLRNRLVKSAVRTVVKKAKVAAEVGGDEARAAIREAESVIASAKAKGILHPRSASRQISRLTTRANWIMDNKKMA